MKIFIIEALQNNQVINVSFDGIRITTPSFIEALIGDLFSYYTKEQISNLISFTNFSKNTEKLIIKVKNIAEVFIKRK